MPTLLFLNPGRHQQGRRGDQPDRQSAACRWPGVFTGTPATGLQQTVLLHTTKNSELVDGMTAQFSPQKIDG